jgi:hypothetical protein
MIVASRARRGVPRPADGSEHVAIIKDVVGLLLILLLMPVWMVIGLVAGIVMLGRSVYRWARGNTTSTSRVSPQSA